jgi:uncharacterized protein (TIGR03437 family)
MKRSLAVLLSFAGAALCQNQAIISTIAGNGTHGFSGDGGPAVLAQFNFLIPDPADPAAEEYCHIAFDADGNLYVPDQANDRIRKITPGNIITTVAGNGVFGYSGNGGPALQASLASPVSVAFDPDGNLYIVDQDNHRVRKMTRDGTLTTVVGNGSLGTEPGAGNGGPAILASLDAPGGIAIDPAGVIFISDTYNDQVRKVSGLGIITAFAGTTDQTYGGDGGPAVLANLNSPAGLALDAQGNLYIADQLNNRIRKVSTDGIITTFAGNGNAEFSGDGGPARSAGLNYPSDVAFDAAGNLYIADERNNRVRKVTPGGVITTVAGNGIGGFSGDGGPPLAASLNHPSGLAFDKQGNLYIVDHWNFRIRKVVFNPALLSVSTASLAFAAAAGGAVPAAQQFTLSLSGPGTLSYAITSNQTWLAASPPAGTIGSGGTATITVSVNLSNLAPGEYDGSLSIAAAGASNSPQSINVHLSVRPLAAPVPTFSAAGVAHAASFIRGPVAAGEIVSIFGSNLGPAAALEAQIDPATGRLAAALGGVSVLFNDMPGALFFVRQDQINVQVPYELAGQTAARIVVRFAGASSAPVTVPVAAAAPGIFTAAQGVGQAAALNQDSSANSPANPAGRNSVVQIYLTGQGITNPPVPTGQLPRPPFPAPALAVAVRIGGKTAQTPFVGLAPGLAGLLQINAVVPQDVVPGDNVALEVDVGSFASQPGVTLAVR